MPNGTSAATLVPRRRRALTMLELIAATVVLLALGLVAIPTFSRLISASSTKNATASLVSLTHEAEALAALRTGRTGVAPSQADWDTAVADCKACASPAASAGGARVLAAGGWTVQVYAAPQIAPASAAYGQVVVDDLSTGRFVVEMLSPAGDEAVLDARGFRLSESSAAAGATPLEAVAALGSAGTGSTSTTPASPSSSGASPTTTTTPPITVQSMTDTTSEVGTAVALQVQATDSTGATLTYNASGLPGGVSIDPATGAISGTPTTPGTFSVAVAATDPSGATGETFFTWTVVAPLQVRVHNGAGQMVFLSSSAADATVSGNASVHVSGALDLASSSPGVLALSGNAQVTSNEAIETPANPATAVTASGTASVSPAPTQVSAVPDPLASLPAPSATGLSLATFSGNTLEGPGQYTSPVALSGKASVTLAPGVYIFDQGLSVSGQASLTSSGGVLLYLAGGSLSLTGEGKISLAAASSGPWSGVVIFQSRHDASTMALSGNGTGVSYGGTVYAPDAPVSLTGNGTLSLGGLVAARGVLSGNSVASVDATVCFTVGAPASYSVDVSGYPTPSLKVSGALLPGITFTDNKNGTGTFAGTPSSSGSWTVTLSATNSTGTVQATYVFDVS